MRSLARQNEAELGGRLSVLAMQKRDHVELGRLLRRLESAAPREQPAVLLRMYRLVFPHAFAEESVLWPVIRRILPDGEVLTLQVEVEHQRINQMVTRLERLKPGSPEHRRLLPELVTLLREDVRDEEDELLPRLQSSLAPTQLRLLGLAWELVRRIAPTRAHPIVSRRPPGNVLAALPLSLLDRSRDLVDGLRLARPGRGAPVLDPLSRYLAGASHAVERGPGMRRGEDPATRMAPGPRSPWRMAAAVTLGAALAAVLWKRQLR
jgi:hypothetical protein